MSKQINQNQLYLYIIGALFIVAVGFSVYTWNLRKTDDYKAVFLTNDQVFFGSLVSQNATSLTLDNVFYVTDRKALEDANTAGDISLVKAGREVHGPTDSIQISRDQVLYTQTLADDSKILGAIRNYQRR